MMHFFVDSYNYVSYGETIPLEKQNEFKQKIEPRLSVLSEIGVLRS